jgi:ssDNA thymidine ADP-ribosyltransferase, DarT
MNVDSLAIKLYHITDINNLPAILKAGGLLSDVALDKQTRSVIGYDHIKHRRMTQYRVPCCDGRFVGEFVPFYYCPRSPMLYTINNGNTGKPTGYQENIIHLQTSIGTVLRHCSVWAISDGNAGARYTSFYSELDALHQLDWEILHSNNWGGDRRHKKSAEFLAANFFPWEAIESVGCPNSQAVTRVAESIAGNTYQPQLLLKPDWYY